MIRSFADKMKVKQEAYEAEQKVLAEQAEQARIQKEEEAFEKELLEEKERLNQILLEDSIAKDQEYLEWKQEQKILREQAEQEPATTDTGVGIGHESTWQLTWKSFSTHPKIINLPMSEKIRLYKIAERQQIDRLNYYTNLHSEWRTGTLAGNSAWADGVIGPEDNISVITGELVVHNSVDVNVPITIASGGTLTINGVLTANVTITNYGTLIVNGIIIKQENITTLDGGTLVVN